MWFGLGSILSHLPEQLTEAVMKLSRAPGITVMQVSPVHSGICEDPEAEADRLFERLVGGAGQASDPSPM